MVQPFTLTFCCRSPIYLFLLLFPSLVPSVLPSFFPSFFPSTLCWLFVPSFVPSSFVRSCFGGADTSHLSTHSCAGDPDTTHSNPCFVLYTYIQHECRFVPPVHPFHVSAILFKCGLFCVATC